MKKHLSVQQIQIVFGVLVFIFLVVTSYLFYTMSSNISALSLGLASTTTSFNKRLTNLESGLSSTVQTSNDLSQRLADQQNKSESFQQTIGGIASTVNTLEKLSKTDQELLQKYSKVSFLNENYVPIRLSNIDPKYLQDPNKTLQFHTFALTFLTRMMDDASNANSKLQVVSAYRSFGTQSILKASYSLTYGSGANKFSADQGYSEHQLGTTVDLTSPDLNDSLTIKFENSLAFNWLVNNAYRYGFILSYPKNNTYYQYEPWHWRFVGVPLATLLHNQNKNFYDLDQRTIDTYLATIFD